MAELRGESSAAGPALRALVERGLIERIERKSPRDLGAGRVPRDSQPTLTADQQSCLTPIFASIRAARTQRFLLQGVTGSGKTEVYMSAVAEAIAAGRQALVLVPEITLTHQIVRSLRARFGDALAVLHSGLRPSERLEQWQRLRRGTTPIAVGARSALFAPLERLGLIVIDEEHDTAYKNEEGFRYHACELAERRAPFVEARLTAKLPVQGAPASVEQAWRSIGYLDHARTLGIRGQKKRALEFLDRILREQPGLRTARNFMQQVQRIRTTLR